MPIPDWIKKILPKGLSGFRQGDVIIAERRLYVL
jgi:hypothetical protein